MKVACTMFSSTKITHILLHYQCIVSFVILILNLIFLKNATSMLNHPQVVLRGQLKLRMVQLQSKLSYHKNWTISSNTAGRTLRVIFNIGSNNKVLQALMWFLMFTLSRALSLQQDQKEEKLMNKGSEGNPFSQNIGTGQRNRF